MAKKNLFFWPFKIRNLRYLNKQIKPELTKLFVHFSFKTTIFSQVCPRTGAQYKYNTNGKKIDKNDGAISDLI